MGVFGVGERSQVVVAFLFGVAQLLSLGRTCNQTFHPTGPFMNVYTTLSFYGRTEEAVKFYGRTIEAETLFLMRFRDCPEPSLLKLVLLC